MSTTDITDIPWYKNSKAWLVIFFVVGVLFGTIWWLVHTKHTSAPPPPPITPSVPAPVPGPVPHVPAPIPAPVPAPTAVDCVLSPWGALSPCSASCGGGTQSQSRTIVTEPAFGGQACGSLTQSHTCAQSPCAVDCVLSPWSALSPCSASCGPGTQSKSRTIVTEPAFGGQACGSLTDSHDCNLGPCPSPPPACPNLSNPSSIAAQVNNFQKGCAASATYNKYNKKYWLQGIKSSTVNVGKPATPTPDAPPCGSSDPRPTNIPTEAYKCALKCYQNKGLPDACSHFIYDESTGDCTLFNKTLGYTDFPATDPHSWYGDMKDVHWSSTVGEIDLSKQQSCNNLMHYGLYQVGAHGWDTKVQGKNCKISSSETADDIAKECDADPNCVGFASADQTAIPMPQPWGFLYTTSPSSDTCPTSSSYNRLVKLHT